MSNSLMNNAFTKKQTDIAKGVAIILMLTYHLFHEAETLTEMHVNYAPFSSEVFSILTGFGNICVAIFVFLTAFGISRGIIQGNIAEELTLRECYQKSLGRFGKLALNFFLMYVSANLLFFSFFNYPSLYGDGKQGIFAMLIDALGLAEYFGTPTLNMTWWYMGIAYALIFVVPLLAFLFRRVGYPILAFGFLFPFLFTLQSDLDRYFCVAVLGVAAAYGNWFEKIFSWKLHKALRCVLALALVIILTLVRQNWFVHEYLLKVMDAPIAFVLILFAVELFGAIPVVRDILAFLGKHSMNMYFVHTFFYMILFRQYIYHFEYWLVTLVILLAVSLAYSVVLELIKKGAVALFRKIRKK